MEKRDLSLMDSIMNGIDQTDEWMDIQLNDPGLKAAASQLRRAMERAKAYLPKELYNELSDAQSGELAAHSDLAILYGMHVAAVIQAVAANPSELTRFWEERKEVQA